MYYGLGAAKRAAKPKPAVKTPVPAPLAPAAAPYSPFNKWLIIAGAVVLATAAFVVLKKRA